MQIGTHALQSDFDAESDTLYLYSKKVPVASSVELGNLLIDFAKDGTVVGIECLNATQTLAHMVIVSHPTIWKDKTRLDEAMLAQVKKAHVSVHTEADLFVIAIELYTQDQQVLKGNLGVPIPTGSEKELLKVLKTV
ncbi:DUF2283 domain-containing protein [Candidatus Micrarchaeota archaeon]|nr:DUF2283 domain-containing protein [Candidatus Micrarchaeota archaeon]